MVHVRTSPVSVDTLSPDQAQRLRAGSRVVWRGLVSAPSIPIMYDLPLTADGALATHVAAQDHPDVPAVWTLREAATGRVWHRGDIDTIGDVLTWAQGTVGLIAEFGISHTIHIDENDEVSDTNAAVHILVARQAALT